MKIEVVIAKGNATPQQKAAIEAALIETLRGQSPATGRLSWASPQLRTALPDRWRGWQH